MGGGIVKEIKLVIDADMRKALDECRKKVNPNWTPIQLKILHEEFVDHTFKGLRKILHCDEKNMREAREIMLAAEREKGKPLTDSDYIRLAGEMR